ncbi:hypothetical protein ILUMI_10123 [Ignelater luminosus]|uniref:Uncharacterized protein n=1 Tax=Ignelater luminosus TaxID=2038154 RepID=A0A8K0GFA4_IGNLU|nr:hypothetical protein ILUMI_10123 [Ignelater luminosus]
MTEKRLATNTNQDDFFDPVISAICKLHVKKTKSLPAQVLPLLLLPQVSLEGETVNSDSDSLFNTAYARTVNIEKAQDSFRRAGIFSYDPDHFGNEDFAPSLVTDTCLEEFADNILEATKQRRTTTTAQPGCTGHTSK